MVSEHRIRLITACECERVLPNKFEEPPMRQHRRWLVPLPLKLSAASIADISEFNAAEQTTKRREFEYRGKYHEV